MSGRPYPEAFQSERAADHARIACWAARLMACVPATAPRDVCLDIGCGVGRFTRPLSASFARAIGLDQDLDMIRLARRAAGETPVHYVVGSALGLPFGEGVAGLVLASMVLEHVRDRAAFVGELARVSSPAGVVVLRTMLPEDVRLTSWYVYCPEAQVIEAARTPTLDEVATLASRAGLACESVTRVVERAGVDIAIGPLSRRVASRAYQALRAVPDERVADAVRAILEDERLGRLSERLSCSLITLRRR